MTWSDLVLHKALAQGWANVGPASNDGKYTGYGNINSWHRKLKYCSLSAANSTTLLTGQISEFISYINFCLCKWSNKNVNWLNLSDINSKSKISGISEYGTRLCIRGHVMCTVWWRHHFEGRPTCACQLDLVKYHPQREIIRDLWFTLTRRIRNTEVYVIQA